MTERILFADRVEELVRVAVGDRGATDIAVSAHADQVVARLTGALSREATEGDRVVALMDVFMHGALRRLAEAAAGEDRIVFAEAEVAAWAVAAAMDRAADAAERGDRETVVAAMSAAEAVLGSDLRFLLGLLL